MLCSAWFSRHTECYRGCSGRLSCHAMLIHQPKWPPFCPLLWWWYRGGGWSVVKVRPSGLSLLPLSCSVNVPFDTDVKAKVKTNGIIINHNPCFIWIPWLSYTLVLELISFVNIGNFYSLCLSHFSNFLSTCTVNPQFKPWGLINFMVHSHPGSNQERGEIGK